MCGHIFPKGAFTIWSFVCRRNTFEPNSEYDGQGHCLWRKRRPWDCHRWRVQGLTTRFPNGSNINFRLQASGCCRSTLQPTMPLMPMSLWVSTNLGFWQIKKSEINLIILWNLKPKVKPAGGNSNSTQYCWFLVGYRWAWTMVGWIRRQQSAKVLMTLSGERRLVEKNSNNFLQKCATRTQEVDSANWK